MAHRRQPPEKERELSERQKAYLTSWLSGVAFGLPSESIHGDEHPFADASDEEVAAIWERHRDDLMVDYGDDHQRPPWPDVVFGLTDD